jgi:hypothetical protein
MQRMRASLLVVFLIAACGVSKPSLSRGTAGPPPTTCDAIHVSIEGTATADEPVSVTARVGADPTTAIADAQAAAGHAAVGVCHDDHWSSDAIDCFARAATDDDQRACTAAMPAALARSLRKHVDAAVDAAGAVTLTRGSAAPVWRDIPADTGVAACDDFIRGFNALMSCDKMPEQAREAAAGTAQQLLESFRPLHDPNAGPEVKQHAADGCTKALEAVRQNATEMHCPMP